MGSKAYFNVRRHAAGIYSVPENTSVTISKHHLLPYLTITLPFVSPVLSFRSCNFIAYGKDRQRSFISSLLHGKDLRKACNVS